MNKDEIIKTQQAEIDSLKDFKEIAESKVTDLNPIGLARTNQLLSRQCHKLQEESEKKDKIIEYMANFINHNTPYTKDTRILENERGVRNTKYTEQFFEGK